MHALHRILVNLRKIDITNEYVQSNKEEAIDSIRDSADLETQDFYRTVFDWRETANAGRWSYEFPENVILGSENSDTILTQIQHCQKLQKDEIIYNLNCIKKELDDSITTIVKLASNESNELSHPLYLLGKLVALLYGEYTFDSYFYDLDARTSKITSSTIEKIKQSPEQWAIVLFDYHS